LSRFEGLNTQVLGISVDSVPGLKAWADSLGGITYPLLSDFYPHGQVAQLYGVLRQEGFTERAIFVVDKQGIIRYRDIHDIGDQPKNEDLFKLLRTLEPEAAKKLDQTEAEPPAPAQQPSQPARGAGHRIVMYCTQWCPDCRAARQYLDQRGAAYTTVDIIKDRAGEKRVLELAKGKLVTPTFEIDDQVVIDFDRRRLEEILGRP
jgi:glutaredoxin